MRDIDSRISIQTTNTTIPMSLHAVLSPEALSRLERQKRNSTVSSIVISILTIVLVGISLAMLLLPAIENLPPEFQYIGEDKTKKKPPENPPVRYSPTSNPSSPKAVANPLVVDAVNDISLPKTDSLVDAEGLVSGNGNGLGDDGIGWDDGGPDGPPGIPIDRKQRCSKQDRLSRISKYGGKPQVEDAVIKALLWMKQNQQSDGSWGQGHKVGMTGLALLAYLGHCETPDSEEFGQSCLDAIVYLLQVGTKNSGKLATNLSDRHWPYEHAIATYALAEAFSFGGKNGFGIPRHKEVLTQATNLIIVNQHSSGGWDYAYDISGNRGGDLSIVAWHIQALKASKVTGIAFPSMKATVKKALAYVSARQAANGRFAYTGSADAGRPSLTGAGVLAFQMWGKGSRKEVRNGAKYILREAKLDYNGAESDLYAHYYHSQAMMQRGGEQWQTYNEMFRDQILLNQNDDGSWKKPGGNGGTKAVGALFAKDTPEGIHYRTCLCTLMLEVYYRYLPGTH